MLVALSAAGARIVRDYRPRPAHERRRRLAGGQAGRYADGIVRATLAYQEAWSVLSDYIAAAMQHAVYKRLIEDGSHFGHIPSLEGVWANADTPEGCAAELREVLE